MKSRQIRTGRRFCITFDHGREFISELEAFCRSNQVRQGYLPIFIAGFKDVELVEKNDNLGSADGPVWSTIRLTDVEAVGGGIVAWDEQQKRILPHLHVSVGLKDRSAAAHTSHLLSATVQFVSEIIFVEIVEPQLRRFNDPERFNISFLKWI